MSHLRFLVLDTNFLLDYPMIEQEAWSVTPLVLVVPDTVYCEVQGLTNNEDKQRSRRARRALSELNRMKIGRTGSVVTKCRTTRVW